MSYKPDLSFDNDNRVLNPINMIPLIDVMLVLLVIFMIAMPTLASSVKLSKAGAVDDQEGKIVKVIIKTDGSVFIDDQEIKLDSANIKNSIFQKSKIILTASDEVPYGVIREILAQLSTLGASSIAFAGADPIP